MTFQFLEARCILSVDHAPVLAKIEKNEGLRATYFVNPHSDFYNISEKNTLSSLLEILSLGHELGLYPIAILMVLVLKI